MNQETKLKVCKTTNINEWLQQTELHGKQLYKSNTHYRNLATCLEHPEFKSFVDTYFKDPCTFQTMLMYMNIYSQIQDNSNVKLNGYQKLSILDSMIKNSETRQLICKNLNNKLIQ